MGAGTLSRIHDLLPTPNYFGKWPPPIPAPAIVRKQTQRSKVNNKKEGFQELFQLLVFTKLVDVAGPRPWASWVGCGILMRPHYRFREFDKEGRVRMSTTQWAGEALERDGKVCK